MTCYVLFLALLFQAKASYGKIETITNSQNITQSRNLSRQTHFESSVDTADPSTSLYEKHRMQANPFVPYPFTTIIDEMKSRGKTIIHATYHTAEYGLRIVPEQNEKSERHFILSGDSNMFGVGLNDNQTLPYFMNKKIKNYYFINMGLGGTGPNHTLYFLQHFPLKNIVKNKTRGIFLYDYHPYLIERVIGSKQYLKSTRTAPRYIIEGGKLVYMGTFENYWPSKFYTFLNTIPFNEILFPNLPKINKGHLELTARILAEMKQEYQRQTHPQNKFVVSINRFLDQSYRPGIKFLKKSLEKEGIEVIVYTPEDKIYFPRIPEDKHMASEAQENYSSLLIKKLNLTNQ